MEVNSSPLFSLQIDERSHIYLSQIAKWAKFLSIVGFVMCGIIVLFGLFSQFVMNQFGSVNQELGGPVAGAVGAVRGFVMGFYVVFAILYFFPLPLPAAFFGYDAGSIKQ